MSASNPPDRRTVEAAIKKFLVVGPGYYGRSDSLKEAKKNCMKEGCKAKEMMIAFAGSDDIDITDGGFVSADFI